MPSRLKFFIGYDEREFANKLIGEVNSDTEVVLNTEMLDDETVKIILRAHPELTEETLKEQLGEAGIISFSGKYKEGGFEKIKAMYPEITETQVRPGVITTASSHLLGSVQKLAYNDLQTSPKGHAFYTSCLFLTSHVIFQLDHLL